MRPCWLRVRPRWLRPGARWLRPLAHPPRVTAWSTPSAHGAVSHSIRLFCSMFWTCARAPRSLLTDKRSRPGRFYKSYGGLW